MKLTTLLILTICSVCYSQKSYTLANFGIHSKRGCIDVSRMTQKQADTIVVCTINCEDQLDDICIYSNSKQEIIIYTSLGNGLFYFYKTIPLQKRAKRIEPVLQKNYPIYLYPLYDLKIIYDDQSEKTIYNYEINSGDAKPESKVPKWNALNDARVFVYDFTFVKSWQSERNGQPQSTVTLGDIDNDGKNEMVYTFFPVVDSGPPIFRPTRMVIFESVGRDQFRIDWDTILENGGGNAATHILTDFDRNGKKEFFGLSTDPNTGWGTYGLFECSGERRYRFWGIEDFIFLTIVDVKYLDTMTIIDSTTNPGVWLNCYPSGFPPNIYDRISPYKYSRKYLVSTFGHYEFKPLGGSAVDFIRIPWRIDDIDLADIDRDGKDEVVLGNLTETIDYMDSTGIAGNLGYEFKSIVPEVPLSGHWVFTKDFDEDGYNEIIACGVGGFSGSIGVVKHTGAPGENRFSTMWWDTTGIVLAPNWGIDTGTIDKKFSVLYPVVVGGFWHSEHLYTFSRDEIYSFYKSSLTILDTTSFIQAKLFDIDKDTKMDIAAPTGFGLPPIKQFLCLYKKDLITVNSSHGLSEIINYKLYQNYPNPFNPNTNIIYEIPKLVSHNISSSHVQLIVFDILGKEISTLVNQEQSAGRYEVEFNASNLPSGIYFYSLLVDGNIIDRKKMIYLK